MVQKVMKQVVVSKATEQGAVRILQCLYVHKIATHTSRKLKPYFTPTFRSVIQSQHTIAENLHA